MPERIQMRRLKGWRKPEGSVYVGRPTRWGNPFTGADAAELYARWLRGEMTAAQMAARGIWPRRYDHGPTVAAEARTALRGKALLCWCRPGMACHADVLIEIANG